MITSKKINDDNIDNIDNNNIIEGIKEEEERRR